MNHNGFIAFTISFMGTPDTEMVISKKAVTRRYDQKDSAINIAVIKIMVHIIFARGSIR